MGIAVESNYFFACRDVVGDPLPVIIIIAHQLAYYFIIFVQKSQFVQKSPLVTCDKHRNFTNSFSSIHCHTFTFVIFSCKFCLVEITYQIICEFQLKACERIVLIFPFVVHSTKFYTLVEREISQIILVRPLTINGKVCISKGIKSHQTHTFGCQCLSNEHLLLHFDKHLKLLLLVAKEFANVCLNLFRSKLSLVHTFFPESLVFRHARFQGLNIMMKASIVVLFCLS